ncbi:MAG: FAD-dependent oxidoreductase [Candidatus Micrarchaeia archaeon]
MLKHDVLVIGAGLAGMRAALEAHDRGCDVAIVSKLHPMRSHSGAAQGGINAAIGKNDSWQKHFRDTVVAGDWLCDQDAVEVLCREAPNAIRELEKFGVLFSRDGRGDIAQRPFGGQGVARTCFAADKTGHEMLNALYGEVQRRGITVYEEWFVTALAGNGACTGAVAWEIASGEIQAISAKAVVLATGGLGRLYGRTTNALCCTGDGMALALRAGALLKDIEFIQFHPTTLAGNNILISEAARGEGGVLLNRLGERFMKKYAREAELAPRDVVARSIQREIDAGNGFPGGYVQLDLRGLGKEKISERLPQVREICMHFAGIDPAEEPIPVQPAQHYAMGGIAVDLDGASSVSGLFAAGECACSGVHGANRVGGNSLLETIVFGKRVGRAAARYAARASVDVSEAERALEREKRRLSEIFSRRGRSHYVLKRRMQEIMDRFVGIFRNARGMREASDKLAALRKAIGRVGVVDKEKEFNTDLLALLELDFSLEVAMAVVASALARKESRGAHYRTDYPKPSREWLRHTLAGVRGGEIVLDYEPVRMIRLKVKGWKYT